MYAKHMLPSLRAAKGELKLSAASSSGNRCTQGMGCCCTLWTWTGLTCKPEHVVLFPTKCSSSPLSTNTTPAADVFGSAAQLLLRVYVSAGKHERAAAAIAIQKSVKEQLQQQMVALTASQNSGSQDGAEGEDEEDDEVVAVEDSSPVNLSQFGKAFKVCEGWPATCCGNV